MLTPALTRSEIMAECVVTLLALAVLFAGAWVVAVVG
jgi:hypothetical protein